MSHRIGACWLMGAALAFGVPAGIQAQGRGGPAGPPATARAAAPIDLTGYWVSHIVDEWRFRVAPQKGDIPYLPINAAARRVALAWDPARDEAEGNQCKAYGAVGVMQRPGRLHISWEDDNTLKIETDAGTQTRLLHFVVEHEAAERLGRARSARLLRFHHRPVPNRGDRVTENRRPHDVAPFARLAAAPPR